MKKVRMRSVFLLVSGNRFFSGMVGIQVLWLLYMVALLFQGPLYREIKAGDLMGTGARELYDTEDGVGFLGREEGKTDSVEKEMLLFYEEFALQPGGYEVTVEYEADYDGCASAANILGEVEITAGKNAGAFKASPIILRDGATKHTERMWVRSGGAPDDLKLHVWYYGAGDLILKRITIEERVLYRFVRLAGFLLLFVILDFLYLCFVQNSLLRLREETKWKILGLGSIIFLSSLTCFTDFVYDGHDMAFHMERIYRLAESVRDLQIPQRIAFRALNGYGYASSLLYGDLFLYVPAVLYCLFVPLQTCYQLYLAGVNAATCLISYHCFERISRDVRLGVIGSFAYTLSAYRMTNILTRAAVGEYTAMVFFPLLCYGFIRVYQKGRDERISLSDCMPLIIGLTGVLESHVLSTEMAMLFLGAAALFFWKKTFAPRRFSALIRAAILTVLLNLWFLYPYLCTYFGRKMGTQKLGGDIEYYSAYLVQLFGDFSPAVNGLTVSWGMQGEMPLTLGISLILGIGLYLVCLIKRESWHLRENAFYQQAGIFAVLSAVAIFLSSNLFWSGNLTGRWDLAGIFWGVLQFPWRMMAMATVFLSFLLVFCLAVLREKKGSRYCLMAGAVILLPGLLSTMNYMTDFAHTADEIKFYSNGHAEQSPVAESDAPWFQLNETDNRLTYVKTPVAGEGVKVLSEVIYEAGTYRVDCANEGEDSSYLVLPVYDYDNFHAYDAEQMNEMTMTTGENGRVSVELPAGYSGTLLLKYEVPVSWRVCEAVSFLTLPVLVLLVRREKRKVSLI